MKDQQKLKIMIISVAFIGMSSVPISTVFSDIMKEFSDSPKWVLDFITVAHAPLGTSAMILVGSLLKLIGIRNICIFALILILIPGIMPLFNNSIGALLLARCFVGFGCGLLWPSLNILSTRYFSGMEKRRILGYQNASQAVGSLCMFGIVIFLSSYGWRWAFSIYFLVLPVLLLLFIFPVIPEKAFCVSDESHEESKSENNQFPFLHITFYVLIGFTYFVCLNTLAPSLSSFLVEKEMAEGNVAGIGMIGYMLGCITTGITYKRISGLFRGLTLFSGMAVTTSGIFMIVFANGLAAVIIGCFLQGLGFSIFNASCVLDVTNRLKDKFRPRVISILMISMSMGSFLSPFLTDMGSIAIYGAATMWRRYAIAAVVLTIFSIIVLVYRLFGLKRENDN